MVRAGCCSKVGLHSGPWTSREDSMLSNYILSNGEGNWRSLPNKAGLLRCGKSCRLRWMNYLRPDIKRGNIGPEEEDLIIRLHRLVGNRWSLIAGRLPGRTDNEIKNYWNSHLCKKLKKQGGLIPAAPRRKQSKSSQRDKKQNSRYINKAFDKLYAPKPIRLTARIATDNSVEEQKLGSSSGHEVEYVSAKEWSDAGEFELTGDAHGFVDSNYQCYLDHPWPLDDQASPVQHDPMMLERLYDEYSQLLHSGVDV